MKTSLFPFIAITLLLASSCNENAKKTVIQETTEQSKSVVKVPNSWITSRVEKTRERLYSSDAGKVVWQAMEAHGGLDKWYQNGPISFRFNYQPLDGGTPRDTYQAIDTWRSKARHYQAKDSTSQYGWDGKDAWVIAKDSTVFPYNTRFWSLTPYFFAAQPFVLDGNGVNLELLDQRTHNQRKQDVIKVTFDEGTGDAPDDYYVLYFDSETHILSVIRYIVSYPGYFKDGGHLPEKFMELNGEQLADGISFPKEYKTHWLTEEELPGEHITNITLSDIDFKSNLEDGFFKAPKGAKILKGL
ncbi:hypothetical protein MTsPCn5_23900 [Croceitalea sp. MTPC5]|uniref:hypothetical protein n=1 Tax=Croceitalea sp. MTPC5 TaxID=3056565 RepID=UPI002B3A4612|nr:hypothetical protein MTsPCn5_23900 [Croceitalea sp. MTPC5]